MSQPELGDWGDALIARLGIGPLLPGLAAEIGTGARLDPVAVVWHDTASAIVVPMTATLLPTSPRAPGHSSGSS